MNHMPERLSIADRRAGRTYARARPACHPVTGGYLTAPATLPRALPWAFLPTPQEGEGHD